MSDTKLARSRKGTWSQALITFCSPFFVFLVLRWAVIEPFVIPSGSMIPTLLIHDHVFVSKFSYGLKIPFGDSWLLKWSGPHRGDVVVFKYPLNPDVFYIKRLIGLPGDKIDVTNSRIKINGEELHVNPVVVPDGEEDFDYFTEQTAQHNHIVRFLKYKSDGKTETFVVPEHNYFFMGDNRDQSSDSRYWGFVDEKFIVGPAQFIWLSCGETLQSAQFVCNPQTIRWNRIFKHVE